MKNRRWLARPAAGAVVFFTVFGLAGSALAQERRDSSDRTMTVRYSDLNISTEAGAMTLYQRIRGAARSVCGEQGYELGLDAWRNWNSCFQGAVDGAVEKVHSPVLNAVHRKSTPEAQVTAMLGH